MMYKEFNWVFKYINNEFKFKLKVYVKIITSKIVGPQNLCTQYYIMRSTKSKKTLILYIYR